MLPKKLRDAIWREYVPGQEITKTPSDAYVLVALEVPSPITRDDGDHGDAGDLFQEANG